MAPGAVAADFGESAAAEAVHASHSTNVRTKTSGVTAESADMSSSAVTESHRASRHAGGECKRHRARENLSFHRNLLCAHDVTADSTTALPDCFDKNRFSDLK
jgi:hypothetical protein